MGVIVWLLIPLVAVVIAMVWTAALARRERRRADERWRAQRLAELGSVLVVAPTVEPTTSPTPAVDDEVDVDRPASAALLPEPERVDE